MPGQAYQDRSGVINTANKSQEAAPENLARNSFYIENPSTNADTLWVEDQDRPAVIGSPSLELKPGQFITWEAPGVVPTGRFSVMCANAAVRWTAREA